MSLVIAARFSNGIFLASDPFVFDNDGVSPLKSIAFNKIYVANRLGCALVSVGSSWVFRSYIDWLERDHITGANFEDRTREKWTELNTRWRTERENEQRTSNNDTLRQISTSSLIIAQKSNVASILLIDHDGITKKSSTFVVSGSGSYLVKQYFRTSGKSFDPTDTLEQCFDITKECYDVASRDLYVIGFPAIALVFPTHIDDFSDDCARAWLNCSNEYFINIKRNLIKQKS